MGFTKYTTQADKERVRMNDGIRAKEVRVLGPDGENFGILPIREAIAKAAELGLDLIEISEVKSKAKVTETKETQVKIGTSQNDMNIKASKIAQWLREGHRVKIDLFLWGRYKYMEFPFLKERLERFLAIIPEGFKVADDIKKSPKGLSVAIERDLSKSAQSKGAPSAKAQPARQNGPEVPPPSAETKLESEPETLD